MNKARERRINSGSKLYDQFKETLSQKYQLDERVDTPKTGTLELFSVLLGKGEPYRALLVAEMCREYAGYFRDNIHSNGNTVYQQVTSNQKIV